MRFDNPERLAHPGRWWVADARWLAELENDDIAELFTDRPFAFVDPDPPGGWLPRPDRDGIVTAELVYDESEPRDGAIPGEAYLAAAFDRPTDQGSKLRRIPAGTRVTGLGQAWYRTSRPEEVTLLTFTLPDNTQLSAWPVHRGSPSLLKRELVPALVVPVDSPLAAPALGAALIETAYARAAAAFSAVTEDVE